MIKAVCFINAIVLLGEHGYFFGVAWLKLPPPPKKNSIRVKYFKISPCFRLKTLQELTFGG